MSTSSPVSSSSPQPEGSPHSNDDRLAHLIKDARRAMERALQLSLVQHQVLFGHWSFLRILWVQDGLTQSELSERSGMTAPTTFSAVRAMEALGYVRRVRKPENRRNSYVYLTEVGRALEEKLVPLAHQINTLAIEGLSEHEVRITRKVLGAISSNLQGFEKTVLEHENRGMPSTRALGKIGAER